MAVSYDESEDVAAYLKGISTADLFNMAQELHHRIEEVVPKVETILDVVESMTPEELEEAKKSLNADIVKQAAAIRGKKVWSEMTREERKAHWLKKSASKPIEWPECGCESLDDHSDMHPETYAHHLRLEHECNKSLEKAVGAKLPCAACASCEDPNCDACTNCRYITQHGFRVEGKDAHLAKAVGAETECLGCANCPDPNCKDCEKCRAWRRKAVFRVQPFDDDPTGDGAGI